MAEENSPGTYTPQQAINLVSQFIHGVPLAGVESNICDVINSMIWTQYPWSWTIANLTSISLIDGVQDYTVTDTNILRPLKFQLTRTDTVPKEVRELVLLQNLSVELTRKGGLDMNTACGWFASTKTVRLMYAASVGTGQSLQIDGQFQQTPTRITDSNMNTALSIPDFFFNVFVEGVKWKVYQLSDDPRAGTVQMTKNGRFQQVYTGQLALFMNQLNYAASREELSTGDQFSWPENALGVGRSYFPGLFGL